MHPIPVVSAEPGAQRYVVLGTMLTGTPYLSMSETYNEHGW